MAAVRAAARRRRRCRARRSSPCRRSTGTGIDALRAALGGSRDRVRPPCRRRARRRVAPRDRPGLRGQGSRRRRDRDAARRAGGARRDAAGRAGRSVRRASARSRSTARRSSARDRGRTALNLAGVEPADLHRGLVLTDDPAVGRERPAARPPRGAARPTAPARGCTSGPRRVGAASSGGAGAMRSTSPDGTAAAILRLAAADRDRAGRPVRPAAGRGAAIRSSAALVIDAAPAARRLAAAPDGRTGRAPGRRGRRGR